MDGRIFLRAEGVLAPTELGVVSEEFVNELGVLHSLVVCQPGRVDSLALSGLWGAAWAELGAFGCDLANSLISVAESRF